MIQSSSTSISEHLRQLQVHVWLCKCTAESQVSMLREEGPALDDSQKRPHQRREQGARNCSCAKKNDATQCRLEWNSAISASLSSKFVKFSNSNSAKLRKRFICAFLNKERSWADRALLCIKLPIGVGALESPESASGGEAMCHVALQRPRHTIYST